VTLIDLAKFLTTRSIARPLCDNWAPCLAFRMHLRQTKSLLTPMYNAPLEGSSVTNLPPK